MFQKVEYGGGQMVLECSEPFLIYIFGIRFDFMPKTLFLGVFLLNKFSWPNGQLSPIACYTYLESYDTQL